MSIWLRSARTHFQEMGGYSSTPRKAKTSEEGGDESLFYAACGMQGWRSSMEDAHIALMKVPQGIAPSAAAIGAARISMNPQGGNAALAAGSGGGGGGGGNSNNPNEKNRSRSMTYSAGDAGHTDVGRRGTSDQGLDASGTHSRSSSTGEAKGERVEGFRGVEGEAVGGEGSGGATDTATGAGWKAVDLLEDAALFGVFDGHGGKAVANFCRDRLPGLLAASPEIRAGNWREGFPRVYHALDDLLVSGEGQEKAAGWGGGGRVDGIGMGSTIVTALLDRKRRQCYVAHAGDSRCVLCRAGRAVQLTRDHKPGIPTEYARIVAAGGHVSRVGRVNDNLNLSRAIGDVVYKRNRLREPKDQMISAEPDVCRFVMTPEVDEFLLLACDGVWEMMDTTRVVTFVRSALRAGSSPREVCESLLDACLSPDPRSTRYAGCDNMTVVLVLLEGWQSALAAKAYTPALTFSGGRLGGVAEAAAALSATLPRLPRKSSNVRPPLPAEFRLPKSAAAIVVRKDIDPFREADPKEGEEEEASSAKPTTERLDGRIGKEMGWPQRRIAEGKVAPPRTAHGIEFALARFSPPSESPAPSAGSRDNHSPVPAALARSRSASQNVSGGMNGRSTRNHMRSSTAPMLPSPLMHLRRAPSEDRVAAAAALAVLGQVGAAGAVASAAAAEAAAEKAATRSEEGNVRPQSTPSRRVLEQHRTQDQQPGDNTTLTPASATPRPAMGKGERRHRSRSEDAGLVFVPALEDVPPVEVTVSAAASALHGV